MNYLLSIPNIEFLNLDLNKLTLIQYHTKKIIAIISISAPIRLDIEISLIKINKCEFKIYDNSLNYIISDSTNGIFIDAENSFVNIQELIATNVSTYFSNSVLFCRTKEIKIFNSSFNNMNNA
jgi:hypothetical protein